MFRLCSELALRSNCESVAVQQAAAQLSNKDQKNLIISEEKQKEKVNY